VGEQHILKGEDYIGEKRRGEAGLVRGKGYFNRLLFKPSHTVFHSPLIISCDLLPCS